MQLQSFIESPSQQLQIGHRPKLTTSPATHTTVTYSAANTLAAAALEASLTEIAPGVTTIIPPALLPPPLMGAGACFAAAPGAAAAEPMEFAEVSASTLLPATPTARPLPTVLPP